jgi:hypothetical protein
MRDEFYNSEKHEELEEPDWVDLFIALKIKMKRFFSMGRGG